MQTILKLAQPFTAVLAESRATAKRVTVTYLGQYVGSLYQQPRGYTGKGLGKRRPPYSFYPSHDGMQLGLTLAQGDTIESVLNWAARDVIEVLRANAAILTRAA